MPPDPLPTQPIARATTPILSRAIIPPQPLAAIAVERARAVYIPKFQKPVLHVDVNRRLQPSADLRALINSVPSLSSTATMMHDGRKEKLVMMIVHDKAGEPVPNLVVRLLEGGQLRDTTRTDKRGIALVTLPTPHTAPGVAPPAPQPLSVEILPKGRAPITKAVTLPAGKQHQVLDVLIDPPLPAPAPAPGADATSAALKPLVDLHYNPLDRLPADFSTDLCEDIKNFFGPTEDPIFAGVEGAADFRQRRIPLIKRVTVPRIGATKADKSAPRRYLVRLRQEWTFLGYTLGELVEAEPLDPGAIINEATSTVSRTLNNVSRMAEQLVHNVSEQTDSALSQTASIDSLLRVSASVRASAGAGGFGLFLPPLMIGGVGVTSSVSSTTSVRNRVDTSLEVNSSLHFAKSVVNTAQRTAQTLTRDVRSTVGTTLKQVSPLLSRVTNLLRWTLYENYIVCTHVEDVVEVADVQIATLGTPETPLFTDEQIVDLRRVFSPGLLEPRLRSQFDRLSAAVDARRGGDLPITAIHVDVQYSQAYGTSAINLRIAGDETTLTLRGGGTRATGTIRLPSPVDDSAITQAEANLTLNDVMTIIGNVSIPNQCTVSRIELGFQTASGLMRRVAIHPGTTLRVTQDQRTDSITQNDIVIPPPAIFTENNPLVVHINNNRTYYFGLLCQAALVEPSLRDDLPHFEAFDSNHEIWRLPIVGFEGNRALVVKDADKTLDEVKDLLMDPGAATIIQLAARGSYAEALQGLLKLPVDTEMLHPALLPAPAPVLPPLAVINALTGGTIPVTGGNGSGVPVVPGGGTGGTGGGGLPIPSIP